MITFSVTNMLQTPNRGSSDNGNSKHLIPDFPISTSSHFMISLEPKAQRDDAASYEVHAYKSNDEMHLSLCVSYGDRPLNSRPPVFEPICEHSKTSTGRAGALTKSARLSS